jgi:hypothetical protein
VAAVRFDRRTVSRAQPAALQRLARFIGICVPSSCDCPRCANQLVDAVVRKLDATEGRQW